MKSEKIFIRICFVVLFCVCIASIHHADKAGFHSAALWIAGRYFISIFAIVHLRIKPELYVINQAAMKLVMTGIVLIDLAADNALIFPR